MDVSVDKGAHDYVMAVVAAAKGEVGGIGYVELESPGSLRVSEFVLLEQEADAASVDFEGDAYIEEITRAAEEGKENQLRCSWHSHGDLATYFSTTDEKGVIEYSQLGMPWLLSLVFNKKGDVSGRVDIFDNELTDQITLSDVAYFVEQDVELLERAKEDVERLVKKPKYPTVKPKSASEKNKSGKQKEYEEKAASMYRAAWLDDDDEDEFEENMEMPDYLEISDFMDDTNIQIMEMTYGRANVERWEKEIFEDEGIRILG